MNEKDDIIGSDHAVVMEKNISPGKNSHNQSPSSTNSEADGFDVERGPVHGDQSNGDDEKQSQVNPTESIAAAAPAVSPPPNGGLLAWSQVFAGFFSFFNSWGVVNAFGVYQNYYQTTLLKHESPSTISWIGSIQAFTIVGVSVLTGRLLDAGYLRPILAVGTFMLVFGLMMTSLASEFYQILLAQGFCVGIGCSCFFSSGIATVAPYFSTRRATALGMIATGSSMGGVVYPIMAQKLIPKLGFPWATRVIAFMILGLSMFPLFILRSRLPPRRSGPLIDMPSLKDWPFVLFSFGTMLAFTGLYVPIFYIEPFARDYNIKPAAATYIVSILNAGSVFGRLLPNFAADRTGPMNMIIPTVTMAAILTYCWIAIRGTGGVIVFALLYGFMSGSLVSLPGSVISKITHDMTILGTRLGMNFGLCSLGVLIGGPVAGAIIKRMDGAYWGAQIFGGTAVILGAGLMMVSRMMMTNGKLIAKA